jgi:transposase InsO family protein
VRRKGRKLLKKHGGSEPANAKVEEVFVVIPEEQKNCKKWLDCEWYGWIVRWLLLGTLEGQDVTERTRRMARRQARRFGLFDGREKPLFFVERGGKYAKCIVRDEVNEILRTYHDCHGHFAGKLLVARLINHVYWPTRYKDAVYYDYFTRHVFACAAEAATGKVAKELLESVADLFGWPPSVYTDNGTHFIGADFHGILVRHGIQHFPAPKTHPSSVALSECYVQLIMNILKRKVQGAEKTAWDMHLAGATQALNARILRIHGYSPAE